MKRAYAILSAATAGLVLTALAAQAAEPGLGEKDTCLLYAKVVVDRGCPNQMDSVRGKMERLSREIAKGTGVYTPAELATLNKEFSVMKSIDDYVHNNNPWDSL